MTLPIRVATHHRHNRQMSVVLCTCQARNDKKFITKIPLKSAMKMVFASRTNELK